jgi:broad specificity phosphatase PhoE
MAKGHERAKSLALLFNAAPALIITSPFLRTKQTAKPLLEKFLKAPEAEWPIEEFTYLSPVRFKNTAVHECRPAAQAYWQLSDPSHVDGEGAESFADFMGRVQNFCGQVAQLREGFVVAFTHEKFMQGVLWNLLSAPSRSTPNR